MSNLQQNNTLKGLWCELLVALNLQAQGWIFRAHRKKFFQVEIDLVFEWKPKKGNLKSSLFLIEVKSLSYWNFQIYRWKKRQRVKFEGVIQTLSYKYSHYEVCGLIAYVSHNRIDFHYLDEV